MFEASSHLHPSGIIYDDQVFYFITIQKVNSEINILYN